MISSLRIFHSDVRMLQMLANMGLAGRLGIALSRSRGWDKINLHKVLQHSALDN